MGDSGNISYEFPTKIHARAGNRRVPVAIAFSSNLFYIKDVLSKLGINGGTSEMDTSGVCAGL